METASSFFTVETLRTFAGQTAAVLILTQIVMVLWSFYIAINKVGENPDLRDLVAKASALGFSIWLQFAIMWDGTMPYVMLLLNATLVALAAMKGAEFLHKGK